CQKRDTALSATLTAAIALSEGKLSSDEISAAMEKAGCLYPQTKSVEFIVHSKTKEKIKGQLVHYAQVSITKIGSQEFSGEALATKFWIAGPYQDGGKINIIKLSNGKYW
ncbi:MAG: hypothetical protein PHN92_06450, partial [Geobacter sp.]|nr:hypothetical protein [Geobacter sp.]